MKIKFYQTVSIITFISLFIVTNSFAFIAFPPITTLSLFTFFISFPIFAISFACSVIFQGWFIEKRLGVNFKESVFQSLKVKLIFIIYALPVLILSDILGTASISGIEKLHLPSSLQNNLWVRGILYFMAGLIVLSTISTIVEINLFLNKWKFLPHSRLKSTLAIANTTIFSIALIVMVLLKTILT